MSKIIIFMGIDDWTEKSTKSRKNEKLCVVMCYTLH